MTHDLLLENRRLLQIEAECIKLRAEKKEWERLIINYFIKYNEFCMDTEDFRKHIDELLK